MIAVEIPEAEAASLEAALDRALAALRSANQDPAAERAERLARLRAETRALMELIRAELHVEENL
ncbi:MAG TPA: hypothetical protein VF546_06560 [Pyrinomonadaceae bacterium]|jgi:hypothetical protein